MISKEAISSKQEGRTVSRLPVMDADSAGAEGSRIIADLFLKADVPVLRNLAFLADKT